MAQDALFTPVQITLPAASHPLLSISDTCKHRCHFDLLRIPVMSKPVQLGVTLPVWTVQSHCTCHRISGVYNQSCGLQADTSTMVIPAMWPSSIHLSIRKKPTAMIETLKPKPLNPKPINPKSLNSRAPASARSPARRDTQS